MANRSVADRLATLIDDPAQRDNPLREACELLLDEQRKQARRLMRIGRISDTYQAQLREANNELQRTKDKLEATLADLNSSYWHLRKLQEVLPVCLECGAVKTGQGSWEPVLEYLKANSLLLSHGYCPTCWPKVQGRWREEIKIGTPGE